MDRRATARNYDALLPEFFPVKLIGAFISVDFVVGCRFDCAFCISRRHPARQSLFDAGVALDTRVSPRRVLAWLRSMPSYRAGVQLRIGHDTDAGLEFEKASELIELLDPGRSVVYLTRKPFSERERAFFKTPRQHLLLKLTATPRSAALGVTADPLELVRSAAGLDPRGLHWVVGPLAGDSEADAVRILEALPPGSRLSLKPVNTAGLPALAEVPPPAPAGLARLEALAYRRGLTVTDWFCRSGLARVGQGFFDVDKVTGQSDLGRRAHDLITCADCPSRTQCHGTLDEPALLARLHRELQVLGLTLTALPARTGPRAFRLEVAEPSSRGDETYLSHALGQPVAITLSTRERGASEGGSFCNVDAAVLRRWYATGFLPVTELNAAAEKVLHDLTRRQATHAHPVPLGAPARDRAC
jgi:hypothetical protein